MARPKNCDCPNGNWKRGGKCKVVIRLKPAEIFLVIFADILFYGQQPSQSWDFCAKKKVLSIDWLRPSFFHLSSFTFICHVCVWCFMGFWPQNFEICSAFWPTKVQFQYGVTPVFFVVQKFDWNSGASYEERERKRDWITREYYTLCFS